MKRVKCQVSSVKKRGFTLMELLIVIAIIAILVAVSAVSYSTAQKKSRDTRRTSDIKAIQNAWEQYYADSNANYPSTCDISTSYLPGGFPVDPQSGTAYHLHLHWSSCTALSYCFCAGLEATVNSTTDCDGGTSTTETGTGYTGLYCVKQLQEQQQ